MDTASQPVQLGPSTPSLVHFSGNSKDFFGIWIVNLLLSIVTLGIYSAWATVRTKQYFFSNTHIDKHRFEYLATPIQIFKGRIIASILLVIYLFFTHYFPLVGAVLAVMITFLAPWLINQSFRFNMRMTRFRNVRFNFKGSYGGACKVFLLMPILCVFTMYLLLPWTLKKMDEYLLTNIKFGDKQFSAKLSTSKYLSALLITLLSSFAVIPLFIAGLFVAGSNVEDSPKVLMTLIPAYIACMYLLKAIYQAIIRNHVFNSAEIKDIAQFHSNLSVTRFAIVEVTNILAIGLTLGLAYPWAKIRKTKVLAEATAVTLMPAAKDIIDTMDSTESSLGDEASNLFDVDVSLT
ncbi:YjgN family protein [Pseudoalteromonas umbrosa]|uniref:YjgN family protein n=1 Tax=Pseudoalteromonas umbrosa TaxID=3048489 RepID=UPI0024C46272|nr:YjgN family protein [Pseudoalteromonas sp. B95]MDK1288153.1 YjgN family protein [Pseudoalteromonas sp. B95]